MELELAFWAEDRREAEAQAVEWGKAEPNVVTLTVRDAREERPKRWTVVAWLDLRAHPVQETLGLDAA